MLIPPTPKVNSQPNIDIFKIVREIPLKTVLGRYAPTKPVIRSGRTWFLCPFHPDKNPSISLKNARWKCFGCGAGGDGVDFVSLLFDLTNIQAAKKIACDFGLFENPTLTDEQRERIIAIKKARQAKRIFEQEVNQAYRRLCEVRIKCCGIIDNAGEFGFCYSHIPYVLDMYLDTLLFGTDISKREILDSGIVQRWLRLL